MRSTLPIVERVAAWLTRTGVAYELVAVTAPTAQHEQATTLPEAAVRSVVMVIDDDYGLLVIPTGQPVDWRRLAHGLGVARARPASQSEVERLFPSCDVDAIPAVGLLYDVPMYLSQTLKGIPEIVFPVGKRGTAAKMNLTTFERLVQPYWLDTAGEPCGGTEPATGSPS